MCGDAGRGAVPVVDGDSVGGAVLVLIVWGHHEDVESARRAAGRETWM